MLRRPGSCFIASALCLALALPTQAADRFEAPGLTDRGGAPAASGDYGLPSLTHGGSQAISGEERRLGRAWLRQFRARAPQWQDAIAQDYVESLVARLLPHSGLARADTVVTLVESRLLNAFAVPGGVVGVNAGLFAFAEREAELASVVAHELGHLAQRHYARGRERAEQVQIPTMAAMLAGMLIAAGVAAMPASPPPWAPRPPSSRTSSPTRGASSRRPTASACRRWPAPATTRRPWWRCFAPCSAWSACRAATRRSSCSLTR